MAVTTFLTLFLVQILLQVFYLLRVQLEDNYLPYTLIVCFSSLLQELFSALLPTACPQLLF